MTQLQMETRFCSQSLTKSLHFLIACFLSSSVENKWPFSSSFSSLIDVFLAETTCVLDKTEKANNSILNVSPYHFMTERNA